MRTLHFDSFFKRLIAQKVCTACSRTSYKIVPLTNLNKYLHDDTSETEVIRYDMIYMLTAVGLTPVAVAQYTFTHKQYIEQHN